MLLVEIFVPDIGVRESTLRVQVARSGDYWAVRKNQEGMENAHRVARNGSEEVAIVCLVFTVPIVC